MNQQRRFIALLVGIGATALGMLSKLTIPLMIPGQALEMLVAKLTPSIAASGAALFLGNFGFWWVATYLFLGWKAHRESAV